MAIPLPGAGESTDICAKVDKYVDHHWVGHYVLNIGPVVGITLQHGVDQVTEALTVAARNGADSSSCLHDFQHQGREVLQPEKRKP